MNVARHIPAPGTAPDRSKERAERCKAIARHHHPGASEIKVFFFGQYATPHAEIWHELDGLRSCKVYRVNEGDE